MSVDDEAEVGVYELACDVYRMYVQKVASHRMTGRNNGRFNDFVIGRSLNAVRAKAEELNRSNGSASRAGRFRPYWSLSRNWSTDSPTLLRDKILSSVLISNRSLYDLNQWISVFFNKIKIVVGISFGPANVTPESKKDFVISVKVDVDIDEKTSRAPM